MSLQGSPYSNTYNQDDFDFNDDRYEDGDEDRENEEQHQQPHPDESDEDTEEASETDMGRNEEPLEIKEQMYQDKLASLKKQLQQLKDETHPEYIRRVKKLEHQFKERLRLNTIYRDYLEECVEKEYISEKKAAAKELEEKKIEIRENLLTDLEEKRKTIEAERYTMELTGDAMEVKPVMTRKLRRRPNDPIPVPEKRRKPPTAQLIYLLDEKEIENDLKQMRTTLVSNPPAVVPAGIGDTPMVETKVEDGKLLYERRWFHRGQSVYVEGRDMTRFAANISAISSDMIWVKKVVDGSKA
ncbi:uncharacterized protein CBL_09873 [Carabus blaptoides fortunei]